MKHYRSRSNLRRSRKPKSRNNRRRRTYRYRGGAAGGPAGEIAALNAAFTGALGSEKRLIRAALVAVQPRATKEAQKHMMSLLNQMRDYTDNTQVNAAMLAADLAATTATSQAARSDYLARHVHGDRPDVLKKSYKHSGNSKSQPAEHASPKRSP
jgi:hypothetical protein